ncbi:MAG: response regulator [bacterium]|nr:response regulator [bacterium]
MTTILYIEDDPINARLVRRMLDDATFTLLSAEDGLEGLQIARQQRPDLILMDINLPSVSGLDITRRLKADKELRHIPVIALTGNDKMKDRGEALAAGCDDYLPKPVSRLELLKTIEQHLSQRRP